MHHSNHPPSFPSSGDGADPSGPLVSDEAIYGIAEQIRAAVRRPGTSDIVRDDRQLPSADEERVIAAAAVLDLLEQLPGK
jgi:hypothetical protein